jgi:hypothetical protein
LPCHLLLPLDLNHVFQRHFVVVERDSASVRLLFLSVGAVVAHRGIGIFFLVQQEMATSTASAHWTNFFFFLVVALYVAADFDFDFGLDCVSMISVEH